MYDDLAWYGVLSPLTCRVSPPVTRWGRNVCPLTRTSWRCGACSWTGFPRYRGNKTTTPPPSLHASTLTASAETAPSSSSWRSRYTCRLGLGCINLLMATMWSLTICVQVRHFGSKCLIKRYWKFWIIWKGYVWRLQFQIQNENIPIIYVNITTLK